MFQNSSSGAMCYERLIMHIVRVCVYIWVFEEVSGGMAVVLNNPIQDEAYWPGLSVLSPSPLLTGVVLILISITGTSGKRKSTYGKKNYNIIAGLAHEYSFRREVKIFSGNVDTNMYGKQ